MAISFYKIFLILGFITVCIELSAAGADEPEIIRAWQLNDLFTEKQNTDIDTMINSFHVHHPVFMETISASYLGNAGLAAMSNIFTDRVMCSDFFFADYFGAYLRQSRETKYYNTRRPFSLINFSTGGPRDKNEKMLKVLHTQNVSPDFNLGFRYFNINSDGQYQNQEAVTNAISMFSSYEIENYQLHTNLNLNSARVFENGGLADDSSLYNEDFDTEDHPVRLQNVRNGIVNNSFFISHALQPFLYSGNDTLPEPDISWLREFKLYHILQYNQYRRTYEDDNPQSGFYDDIFIDNTRTSDSVHYRSLTNKLMLQLPAFNRGSVSFDAKGGIKNELIKGSYNIVSDTIFIFSHHEYPYYFLAEPDDIILIDREEHKYGSNALIAIARGSIGDIFGIWGEGSLFFHGHRQGEYNIQAGIRFDFFEGRNRSVIEAEINQKELTPSMFLNSFSSNHFSWNNEFRRIGESILKGSIKMPQRKFMASVNFNFLNNYIYFDNTANPQQYNDVIPVVNVSAKKDFQLWKFYFRNVIEYQISGKQDILPLPDLSIYHSTWFEQKLISDIMTLQVGFDVYYTTEYQGYAYQPAISQFHIQDERMLGNYPFIDVFINVKHKRARMFFKAEHLNSGFLDPEYFSVLHYPRNERLFKFGFSWSFYN